jgi:hypothetical protein
MTTIQPEQIKDVHSAAILALVSSLDTLKESDFPETLSMDFEKLSLLQSQFHFFVVSASMLDSVKNAIAKTNNPNDWRYAVCSRHEAHARKLTSTPPQAPAAHRGALQDPRHRARRPPGNLLTRKKS